MAFKATKYFVIIAALVIAGTRYMNVNRQRINVNNDIGVWDSKGNDGLRYTIVTRSNETNGQFFVAHTYCTSKAQGFYPGKPCSPPQHFHAGQDEEFEVVRGVLMLDWNGTEVRVPVGEKRTVPAGLPHTFWNGGSEPLEFLIKLTPGIPDEGFLEMVAALSQQFGGLGKVNPMQLVLLFSDYDITLTEVPEPLWLAVRKFLVPLARLLGFRSHYSEYVSKAGQPLPVEGQPAVEAMAAEPATAPETAASADAPAPEAAAAADAPAPEAAAAADAEVTVADEVADASESDKSEL